jgi:hypothetical protein
MPDQPAAQPAITEIIAQAGIGGMPRAPRPPNSSGPVPEASPAEALLALVARGLSNAELAATCTFMPTR